MEVAYTLRHFFTVQLGEGILVTYMIAAMNIFF